MKLNLGCGLDIRPGYVNVDFRNTHPSVLEADLSEFPWPFADGCAEEILMLDFLEHFPYHKTRVVLMECYRILGSSGELLIQVPDGDHLAKAFTQSGRYLCNGCGNEVIGNDDLSGLTPEDECTNCGQGITEISEAAMRRLYGGQDYLGNFHFAAFTKQSLRLKAEQCGLIQIADEEQGQQYPNWNFKLRFSKGDPWNVQVGKRPV